MLLENLQKFEWINDPADVRFTETGMMVEAKGRTDFWQNKYRKIAMDSGHFFYAYKTGDFTLIVRWTVQWTLEALSPFGQCGIMVRIDDKNWIKASVMGNKLGSAVTQSGLSDWAMQDLPDDTPQIWYKIKKSGRDYAIYYSTDGTTFTQIRLTSFIIEDVEVKIGAYICSPNQEGFKAVLNEIEF